MWIYDNDVVFSVFKSNSEATEVDDEDEVFKVFIQNCPAYNRCLEQVM